VTAGGEGQDGLGLKAKEKILVQLCTHRSTPDETVFPFEVTQKGLSEHLGLRRSHVAVALQDLAKDGLVEAVKGHVEGADRRQFAYCVTSKGFDTAASLIDKVHEAEVPFEDASGTRTLRVSEIVKDRKVSIASVICQLERGGPVRDEIAVMTVPEKRLISVFCPTCKKQIEVDNVFFDEEVGFDCPGCGRPYRIVPALKREETRTTATASRETGRKSATTVVVVAVLFTMIFAFVALDACLAIVFIVGAVLTLVAWTFVVGRKRKEPGPRSPLRAVAGTLILSPVLLVMWHLVVARIDVEWTLKVLLPICGGIVGAYAGVRRYTPDREGDYLLTSGVLLIIIAASTTFLIEFGPVDVGMALPAAITGGVLVVLSTFRPVDRDAAVLDCGLAAGLYLMMLSVGVTVWTARETIDYVAAGGVTVLGVVLLSLRFAREARGAKDLSSHLVAATVFGTAVSLAVLGAMMVIGGAVLTGAVAAVAAAPFAVIGHRRVFDENWPYRLPLALLIVAVVLLVAVAGLVT